MADPTSDDRTRRPSLLERAAARYDFAAAGTKPEPARRSPGPPMMRVGPAPEALPPLDLTEKIGAGRVAVVGRDGAVDLAQLRDGGFLVPDMPPTGLAEEFRIVKRQLLLNCFDAAGRARDKGNLILVCSSQPNEGKTFCAVNLALSIAAERDLSVLLVDADFAKPEVLSTLGLEGGAGLIDVLADPDIDVASCIIRTQVPGLSVLPAGRHHNDATELLASERMQAVIDQLLRGEHDRIVIFDSPPALASSAAAVLALHAGQTVFVVEADKSRDAEIADALSLLGGCAKLHLLLNRVSFAPGGRRFGSYYGYGE